MIAVDTSALIAILQDEPEAKAFLTCLAQAEGRLLSAISLQEASMVLAGRRHQMDAWEPLDELIRQFAVEIVPHDDTLARIARDAFLRFGKGRHHPAKLNCGDCASYALAKHRRIKLLFKGSAFAHTDITPALPAA